MDISREEETPLLNVAKADVDFKNYFLALGELIVKLQKLGADQTRSTAIDGIWKSVYDLKFGNVIAQEEALLHSSQVLSSIEPKVVLTKKNSSEDL